MYADGKRTVGTFPGARLYFTIMIILTIIALCASITCGFMLWQHVYRSRAQQAAASEQAWEEWKALQPQSRQLANVNQCGTLRDSDAIVNRLCLSTVVESGDSTAGLEAGMHTMRSSEGPPVTLDMTGIIQSKECTAGLVEVVRSLQGEPEVAGTLDMTGIMPSPEGRACVIDITDTMKSNEGVDGLEHLARIVNGGEMFGVHMESLTDVVACGTFSRDTQQEFETRVYVPESLDYVPEYPDESEHTSRFLDRPADSTNCELAVTRFETGEDLIHHAV